ncbi:MAG: glycosyltransferase family 39 protein, partial [Chloroflexota bacterium]|nr:glycosyltransferase family 39 protein [Chloroflexota bacterium]
MSNLFLRLRSPLALIILAYFVLGALYAALTPPWQAPDEPAHYNYVKYLAENRRFPVLQMGDYPHEYLEEIKARRFPPDMSIAPIRYEFHQPPLYYILATPVYLLFGGELLPLRLLSVLLGSALLYVAYRLVRELFPNEEELALWNRYSTGLALGTAAFVAFVPMHVAMTAAVNNDALAELILASVLWMLVRYVGESEKRLIGLGVLMGLGLLTKTTAYIAIPLAILAVVFAGRWSLRHLDVKTLGCCLLLALAIALPWLVRNILVYGDFDLLGLKCHDAVVVGQPRTSEWLSLYGAGEVARRFLFTTFRSFWAQFGWMGVLVDERIYLGLALLCTLTGLGFVLFVARTLRHRSCTLFQRRALGLLALSALFTLLSYLWYNTKFVQHQGRYLFPALVPIGLAFSLGLREILDRAKFATFLLSAVALLLAARGLLRGDFGYGLILVGGTALLFWVKALLPRRYDFVFFTIPFLGLCVLDV